MSTTMADSENELTIQPPNVDINDEMVDEEDILGITEGSQEEGEIMDDEKENDDKKSTKKKRKQDGEDPEMEETGQRKLRKTAKQDYKKLATGKGKAPKSNPKQRKPATPTPQHINSENDDETTGEKPREERTGVKPANQSDEEAPNAHHGEKAPKEHEGEKAPIEHQGDKAPNEQRGEKAPIEHRGEKAPIEHRGEKAPIEHRGEKAPKGPPKDACSSQESEDDSESTTSETDDDTVRKFQREIKELEEMAEDLKRALSEKKKESETSKKNLRLRTKELDETERENRRLRKELEEAKKVNNDLRRENEELEDRLNKEQRTKEQNKEEIRELKERLKAEENEKENYRKVKEEIKRNRTEIQEQLEESKKQLTHTKKKLSESESMNEELINKITRESQKSATTTKECHMEKRQKTRALLIGDSNAKRIKPHLQDDTAWFITENTYRIEDISKVEGINEYDCCVVLLGTNNLKTGNDGIHEARKLMTTLEKHVRIPKFVCEAPPINRRMAIAERKLYNVTLQNQIEKMKNTKIIKMPKDTEICPTEEALSDDLHLNSYHSTLLANKISATVREVKPKKHHEEKNHDTEMTIEAEEEEIKAVIGGGHSKAAELEKEHNVRIKATRHNPNKITIHGKKDQVQRVYDLLKRKTRDLKERRERNAEQKESRGKVPCIFYAQKRCVKGEKCHFLHERRRPSRERVGRSRSPSAGTSDTRTVRIRPRDHE